PRIVRMGQGQPERQSGFIRVSAALCSWAVLEHRLLDRGGGGVKVLATRGSGVRVARRKPPFVKPREKDGIPAWRWRLPLLSCGAGGLGHVFRNDRGVLWSPACGRRRLCRRDVGIVMTMLRNLIVVIV